LCSLGLDAEEPTDSARRASTRQKTHNRKTHNRQSPTCLKISLALRLGWHQYRQVPEALAPGVSLLFILYSSASSPHRSARLAASCRHRLLPQTSQSPLMPLKCEPVRSFRCFPPPLRSNFEILFNCACPKSIDLLHDGRIVMGMVHVCVCVCVWYGCVAIARLLGTIAWEIGDGLQNQL